MKFTAIAALVATVSAGSPPAVGLGHAVIPATRGETGPNIEPLTQLTKTAPSLNPTTGRVPNNALNPGSAEVPDSAREADGAPVMTDVREPHSQTKLQVSSQITDQPVAS